MRWALVMLGLAGCNRVFNLEDVKYTPPDAAPDAPRYPGTIINDPDGDYDEDGLPNAADPCVLIDDTVIGGRDDADMDGVGDLCDPSPTSAGDCLVLFDSFGAPTLSSHWKSDGEIVTLAANGSMHIPAGDETLVYLDQPLEIAAVYVGGYVPYGANGPGARFAVQTFVDVTRSPAPAGVGCSLESDKTSSKIAVVDVVGGTDTPRTSATIGSVLVAAGSNAALRWRSDGCFGELQANNTTQSAKTSDAPPASGVFAIRTLLAELEVRVVAAYGRGCDR